jgi:hypothetical protein
VFVGSQQVFYDVDGKLIAVIRFRARIPIQDMRREKSDMPKSMFRDARSIFLGKTQLMKLRLKAIRTGVWFKVLPRIDRVLVDLTIKVASNICSFTLASNILSVIRKLENIMESKFLRTIREVGFPFAKKISLIARGL